jgi:hypothetical protein
MTSVCAGQYRSWAWEDLNLRPHPYQLNAGNHCADGRSCRSRPTVRPEGMRSISVQVCVLPIRPRHQPEACQHRGPTARPALHHCLPACRRHHVASAATPTAQHGDPQPLLRVDGWSWSSVPRSICTRAVKALSFRSWPSLERESPCVGDALRPWRPDDGEALDPPAGYRGPCPTSWDDMGET